MFTAPILWRHSTKAQRIILRIDLQKRAVILTLPPNASKQHGIAILHANSAWVQNTLQSLPVSSLESGYLLLKGKNVPLIIHNTGEPQALLSNRNELLLTGSPEHHTNTLLTFLHHYARDIFIPIINEYSKKMGLFPTKISFRDTKTRWGSCTRKGRIMLCWRLIMAPSYVYSYVIIHELTHLKHFNHSVIFWDFVDEFCPDGKKGRKKAEKWLSRNGIHLLSMI